MTAIRVPPVLGRGLVPDDAKPGAPPVFVMAYKMWLAHYNLDPSVLGRTFVLNGETLDYYDYVRAKVGGGKLQFDPVKEVAEQVDSNCADLHYRAQAVDIAIAAGIQNLAAEVSDRPDGRCQAVIDDDEIVVLELEDRLRVVDEDVRVEEIGQRSTRLGMLLDRRRYFAGRGGISRRSCSNDLRGRGARASRRISRVSASMERP